MNDRDLSLVEASVRSHTGTTGQHSSRAGVEKVSPRSPFAIAISREVGVKGNDVATEVGRRLDWPVYDRSLLDDIAVRLHRSPSHIRDIDERQGSWLGGCFSSLIDHDHFVGSVPYFEHLLATLHDLGSAGRCVIVGRAANFILPAETTLRIRLVAPMEDRVRVAARRLGLSAQEASTYVEAAERQRFAFLKTHFKEDPADPHYYDLVLNMSRLSVDDAADLITETLCRLEKRGVPAGGTWAPAPSPSRQHGGSDRREVNNPGCVIRGRSPESYQEEFEMKTDTQLQKDVMAEIKWEPCVTATEIGVSVAHGVVTLNGTVATYAEKWAVERAAQRVQGVKAIAEEIQIKPTGIHTRTDAEIAESAVRSLEAHVWVPTDIQVTVAKGWVTLKGVVNRDFQQRAAVEAVRFLAGVEGVSNDIRLEPTAQPSAVKDLIEKALVRNAEIDAGHVKVTADGGAVTLSGSVRSWGEKNQAGTAAWSAPGVNSVRNDIAVMGA